MAQHYQMTSSRRAVNGFTMWLARRELGAQVVLTTTGRVSKQPRSVPVSPLDIDGVGYLVSPYGEVGWVKNVRADPLVRIRQGRQDRSVRLMEMKPEQAAKLLLAYWTREKITRPYFDVGPSPSAADFKEEAIPHPVFRIIV